MKEICFIVPTYPPRYSYAKNLLNSFYKYRINQQSDLFFVFTNNKEREQFGEYDYTVTLPNSLGFDKVKAIINVKKNYALHELRYKYKYYIILDDEALFIKNVDILDVCNQYFESKLLYGNKCVSTRLINKPTFYKLKNDGINENYKIKYIINNLYLWWNNLSIFKGTDLDDFFEKINYSYNTLKEWEYPAYFEMVYQYYLILYKGRNVIDLGIEVYNSLVEYSGFITPRMKKKLGKLVSLYNFYWSSKNMLPYFDNPKCFIVFHLDRENIKLKEELKKYWYVFCTKLIVLSEKYKFMEYILKIYRSLFK